MELPLARWADDQLAAIGRLPGGRVVAGLTGAMLLGERATLNGFRIPGRISAGGGCRLWDTATVPLALNLARPDDRTLLPALFGDESVSDADPAGLRAALMRHDAAGLVARGREMGLAIAALDEQPLPGERALPVGGPAAPAAAIGSKPLVIDLSALWAGPLCGNLLHLTGAEVVKVENPRRPDAMRTGDPALFARLNQGKANVALDPAIPQDRAALLDLIARADVVIDSSRPRALEQFGIVADRLVGEMPGLVWMSITGHGIDAETADWVGFGDDCGVAGGLSAALLRASGTIGFGGDAIADPLTGIRAARRILEQRESGRGARLAGSMSGTIASAIADERRRDAGRFDAVLSDWAGAIGRPFPAAAGRASGPVAALGADTQRWCALC